MAGSGEKKILIIAGEASGDLHGSKVVEALSRLDSKIRVYGVGSTSMRQAGAQILLDSSALAVVGITEVIGHFRSILKAFAFIKQFIRKADLNLLILIDFPDFNIPLAKVAQKVGVPVLYYISPQVWAWRSGRVKKIARRINKMAVIFPFEVPIYQEGGVAVEFVGHPLLDTVPSRRPEDRSPSEEGRGNPLIALLPGSRIKEVQSLLPEMMAGAKILFDKNPGAKFIIAVASTIRMEDIKTMVQAFPVPVDLVQGKTYEAIQAADLAIVASGTATLETALLEKPMIIVYRVSPLSFWVGKRLVKVRCIGLANIVAGTKFIPELLQEEACGAKIAAEAERIWEDSTYRQSMISELQEVRKKLGAPGASERVARIALEMMKPVQG